VEEDEPPAAAGRLPWDQAGQEDAVEEDPLVAEAGAVGGAEATSEATSAGGGTISIISPCVYIVIVL
jgi:hypothetical protein